MFLGRKSNQETEFGPLNSLLGSTAASHIISLQTALTRMAKYWAGVGTVLSVVEQHVQAVNTLASMSSEGAPLHEADHFQVYR
jgi:hypothetical protein